jgi:hypothetical protein
MSTLLDLAAAVVLTSPDLSGPERKAVAMLLDEVERRTQLRWREVLALPDDGTPVVAVGRAAALRAPAGGLPQLAEPPGPEGYSLRVEGNRVWVTGADARGVLFGVGRLLRALRMGRGRVAVPADLDLVSAPAYPLRGHQLGYRPKTNSYDAWSLPMWEQYFRDLAVFGCNAVELIPPRSDDDADSPHFPLPPMEMMVGMSRLLDEYGLDVWVWYPAMDEDYADEATVRFALEEWGEVFRRLPRVDAVFVPGGDPGHTPPQALMALLERMDPVLRASHPEARLWVAPQGFSQEWLEEFLGLVGEEPEWLEGVVFGPQTRIPLPQLRALVPQRYPIRHYPDITHSRQCQYPVPDWDLAYALTEAREGINPRPLGMARIFHLLQPHTMGFITYSEGCNDDVNKCVWSALGWDPEADVTGILREYARYYMGDDLEEGLAHGLAALERNWQGPLLTNAGVTTTLQQFQAMERVASPQVKANWRFQQALYRAYYDAYVRARLLHETALEERAMDRLREARQIGSLPAMQEAEALLDRALLERPAPDLRARVFELAEALFQSIRMQLSVERYAAIDVGRGANLDTIDVPLNSGPWLKRGFAEIRLLPGEEERLRRLAEFVEWTNPGPGGFYDDLGNPACRPHLVRGPGWEEDPAFYESALTGFSYQPGSRISWWRDATALFDAPLQARYSGLDPAARYRIRVVYAGDTARWKIRLDAGDGIEVHSWLQKPAPARPLEFDVPPEATAGGELLLSWRREPGNGGNGRGCQVAEVWLFVAPRMSVGLSAQGAS